MNEEYNPYRTPESNQFNPYTPPTNKVSQDTLSTPYWAEGKYLVMPIKQVELPHRCVRCNAYVTEPIKTRTAYWHTPALYLLILLSWLVYVIVALIVRKKVLVKPGLCEEHLKRYNTWLYASWGVFFVSFITLMINATGPDSSELFGLSLLGILVGILMVAINARVLTIHKIVGDRVYFKKCGQAFLNSLPRR